MRRPWSIALAVSPLLMTAASAPPPAAPTAQAHLLIAQAIDALGGEARLRGVGVVELKAMRRRNALEQSLRPDGPYLESFDELVETRRFDRPALRDEVRTRGFTADWVNGPAWISSSLLVTSGNAIVSRNGKAGAASMAAVATAEHSLALGPERALLAAEDAPDLHIEAPITLHGLAHDVVAFRWRGEPVRILIEPVSHMLHAVEVTRPHPYEIFWSPWGDVTTRTSFDVWLLEPNGLRYPRQWTIERNGRLSESWFIDSVAFDPDKAAALDVPAGVSPAPPVARRIEDIPVPNDTVTLAPGIVQRPGAWNVGEVTTPAGVYVIEGPISNGYSRQIIDGIEKRGQHILGVITTSDSWPHIGGLRQYASRRIPIVALDLNRPILERLFAASHLSSPDALAVHPVAPRFQLISRPTWLGAGDSRMQLLPFRTVTGERQVAIWWPAHRLLYTSDLFTVQPDGKIFLPQYLDEARDLVAREKLDVKTVFGMHYGPTDWATLTRH